MVVAGNLALHSNHGWVLLVAILSAALAQYAGLQAAKVKSCF